MRIGDSSAAWLSRLVQIPSVSPDHPGPRAGVTGEARIAAAIADWFRELGGEVQQEEALPGRSNTYGIWRGRSDRWVAVDVHIDTVGVEQMIGNPFSGEIADGRVYGRGAVDTKASLGITLALLEHMQQTDQTPEPNLLIVATADEESGTSGALTFAEWARRQSFTIDQLLVAEPTLCAPVYGHRGVVRLAFHVAGKSTHSAQPQLGQNAIAAAAEIVRACVAEHERLTAQPSSELGQSPSLTVTMIHGGIGLNVVPDLCVVSIDRRIVTGEKPQQVAQALSQLASDASPLPVTAEPVVSIDAFYQPPDTPWIRELAEWTGSEPGTVLYGTNAYAYDGLARECVVIGPGSIDQAHGDVEWVEIAELEKMARIYARWWGIDLDRR
jgi:acetylornithine deacetylase/succinyl-diaminopimelate desuccinylase-like protein